MERLNRLTAMRASELIGSGAATSEDLVRACLARIAEREPAIGAWTYIDPDHALAQAHQRDREKRRGPLHGIPIGIKDIIDTGDMPTENGSPIYAGNRPKKDAACVDLLRRAGAVIMGKTVTTEFAAFTAGKTGNPHNPKHIPGGSSSGSAAAVADFMVPVALGTQTIGSIVRPSAYCGAVGFKPSYGTFTRAGVAAQAESLDTVGVIARAVEDLEPTSAALLGVAKAWDAAPRSTPPRIGFCGTPHWPKAQPPTIKAMEDAVRTLRAAGAEIADVNLPPDFDRVLDAQMVIMAFEFARAMAWELTHHPEKLSPRLLEILTGGLKTPIAEYWSAIAMAERCRAEIVRVFERHDILLAPSQAGEAPEGLQTQSDLLFQRIWTVLHVPCLTLPAYKGPNGFPIGVQLIGPFRGEARLLSAAAWVEARLTR